MIFIFGVSAQDLRNAPPIFRFRCVTVIEKNAVNVRCQQAGCAMVRGGTNGTPLPPNDEREMLCGGCPRLPEPTPGCKSLNFI